jgi:DNA-binding NtrC family response regulator
MYAKLGLMPHVFIVHDYDNLRRLSALHLQQIGCEVREYASTFEAMHALQQGQACEAVFMAPFIKAGIHFIDYLRLAYPAIPIVMMAFAQIEQATLLAETNAIKYVLTEYSQEGFENTLKQIGLMSR